MIFQSKVVLIVGHDASLTGAPKVLLMIAEFFKKQGCTLIFILGKDGPLIKEYNERGATYIWNKDISNDNLFTKLIFRLKGGKEKYEQNILKKITLLQPVLLFNNTVVNGAIIEKCLSLKIPIISQILELESVIQYYNIHTNNADKVLKNSDRIITASQIVKNNLIQNHQVLANKIDVVYHTIPQKNKPFKRNNSDVFTVASCGTLISRKGIDLFLSVAQKCKLQMGSNKIRFVWIGGNKNSLGYFEIMEDIRKLGITDIIEITGETNNTEFYYAQAAVFLLTSREDPFPLVMLEAAQMSLPIIAFEQSGGAEEFIDNSMGCCVPYIDSEAMTNAVIKLYNEPALLKSMGKAAFEKSKEYTPERTKKDLLNILNKI